MRQPSQGLGEASRGNDSLLVGSAPRETADENDEDAPWIHEDVDELDEEGPAGVVPGLLDAEEELELDEEEEDEDELAGMSPEQLAKVLENEVR